MNRFLPFVKEGFAVCGIMSTGDVLCQTVVDKVPVREIDLKRTARFGAIGLFLIGPTLHFWFRKLDQLVSLKQSKLKIGIKKMALDQAIAAPAYMFTVTCVSSALDGKSSQQIKSLLQNEYIVMLQKNYMIWPFVQTFNFAVVPLPYQVIFAQIIAIFWNGYLSYLLNKRKEI